MVIDCFKEPIIYFSCRHWKLSWNVSVFWARCDLGTSWTRSKSNEHYTECRDLAPILMKRNDMLRTGRTELVLRRPGKLRDPAGNWPKHLGPVPPNLHYVVEHKIIPFNEVVSKTGYFEESAEWSKGRKIFCTSRFCSRNLVQRPRRRLTDVKEVSIHLTGFYSGDITRYPWEEVKREGERSGQNVTGMRKMLLLGQESRSVEGFPYVSWVPWFFVLCRANSFIPSFYFSLILSFTSFSAHFHSGFSFV